MDSWRDRSLAALLFKGFDSEAKNSKHKASKRAVIGSFGTIIVSPLEVNVYLNTKIGSATEVFKCGDKSRQKTYVDALVECLTCVERNEDEDHYRSNSVYEIAPCVGVCVNHKSVYLSHCGILEPTTEEHYLIFDTAHPNTDTNYSQGIRKRFNPHIISELSPLEKVGMVPDKLLLCTYRWAETLACFLYDPTCVVKLLLSDKDSCSDRFGGNPEEVLASRNLQISLFPRNSPKHIVLQGRVIVPPLYLDTEAAHRLQDPIELIVSCRLDVTVVSFGVCSEINSIYLSKIGGNVDRHRHLHDFPPQHYRKETDIQSLIFDLRKVQNELKSLFELLSVFRDLGGSSQVRSRFLLFILLSLVCWNPYYLVMVLTGSLCVLMSVTYINSWHTVKDNSHSSRKVKPPKIETCGHGFPNSEQNKTNESVKREKQLTENDVCKEDDKSGKYVDLAELQSSEENEGAELDVSDNDENSFNLSGGFASVELVRHFISCAVSAKSREMLESFHRLTVCLLWWVKSVKGILLWQQRSASIALFLINTALTVLAFLRPLKVTRFLWGLLLMSTFLKLVISLTVFGSLITWCMACILYFKLLYCRRMYPMRDTK